jgi:iron(III) transport system permease protein
MQIGLNKFSVYLMNSQRILGILVLVPVAFLIIAPAIEILQTSLQKDGALTPYYWLRILSGRMSRFLFYKPLLNTLMVSFGMTILSLLIGSTLAWLVVRTDLPLKHIIEKIGIIPYVIPSWVISLAWISMFRNSMHFGGYQGLVEYFLKVRTPLWISYGLFPIIVTLSLHYFPYTFLLASSALKSVDSHLEETGEMLGAGRSRILRKITFPLTCACIPLYLPALQHFYLNIDLLHSLEKF